MRYAFWDNSPVTKGTPDQSRGRYHQANASTAQPQKTGLARCMLERRWRQRMSRASKIKRTLAAITRMASAWAVMAALVIAGPCAMCFASEMPSHPCCPPGADDYLQFVAAGSVECQSISSSMVASIDSRKDVAPRPGVGGPSHLMRMTSARQETITRLPVSPPAVDTPSGQSNRILQI